MLYAFELRSIAFFVEDDNRNSALGPTAVSNLLFHAIGSAGFWLTPAHASVCSPLSLKKRGATALHSKNSFLKSLPFSINKIYQKGCWLFPSLFREGSDCEAGGGWVNSRLNPDRDIYYSVPWFVSAQTIIAPTRKNTFQTGFIQLKINKMKQCVIGRKDLFDKILKCYKRYI